MKFSNYKKNIKVVWVTVKKFYFVIICSRTCTYRSKFLRVTIKFRCIFWLSIASKNDTVIFTDHFRKINPFNRRKGVAPLSESLSLQTKRFSRYKSLLFRMWIVSGLAKRIPNVFGHALYGFAIDDTSATPRRCFANKFSRELQGKSNVKLII